MIHECLLATPFHGWILGRKNVGPIVERDYFFANRFLVEDNIGKQMIKKAKDINIELTP